MSAPLIQLSHENLVKHRVNLHAHMPRKQRNGHACLLCGDYLCSKYVIAYRALAYSSQLPP